MVRVFAALFPLAVVPLLVSCGGTIQPRTGEQVPTVGRLPGSLARPDQPTPAPSTDLQARSMFDQICRGAAMPHGWVAVRYTADEHACPKRLDADNPYTLAVIYRYADLPIGASLTVCADQPRPANWTLASDEAARDGCPGARVAAGKPTAYLMRRVH